MYYRFRTFQFMGLYTHISVKNSPLNLFMNKSNDLPQPHKKTGIRVKHLEASRNSDPQSDTEFLSAALLQSSKLTQQPKCDISPTNSKLRKRIFQGESRSPHRAIPTTNPPTILCSSLQYSHQDKSVAAPTIIIQKLEVEEVHKQGRPIVIPDPLKIAKKQTLVQSQPKLVQNCSNISPKFQSVQSVVHSSHNENMVKKSKNIPISQVYPTHIGSLQSYFKQPPHVRQQILRQCDPNPPLFVGKLEQRRQSESQILKRNQKIDAEAIQQMEGMRKTIEQLTSKLEQRQRLDNSHKIQIQKIKAAYETQLRGKDSEISRYVLRIDELSKAAYSKARQSQHLQMQIHNQNARIHQLQKTINAYAAKQYIRIEQNQQGRTNNIVSSNKSSSTANDQCPLKQNSTTEYLSPLSVNLNNSFRNTHQETRNFSRFG